MTRCVALLLTLAVMAAADASETARELADAAAPGRLTTRVRDLYGEYVDTWVRERSPELATWLGDRRIVRDGLVAGLRFDRDAKVLTNLNRLREVAPEGVHRFPHLALAFAFAWSAGDGEEPRRYWEEGWKTNGRTIPGMADSFAWYVKHAGESRTDLGKTPWPLLVWLADCDVPFEERSWALGRYRGRAVDSLRSLFAEVPYRNGMAGRSPRLENYVKYGGICVHNVQYHLGVMRSLGVPSMWSGGPGHVWPWWIEARRGTFEFRRANSLGNRTGTTRNLLARSRFHEDDVRLLVSAMNHSYDDWRKACIGARVHELVREKHASSVGLLVDALRRNPFCALAWDGVIASASSLPVGTRKALSEIMIEYLDDHPAIFVGALSAFAPSPMLLARTEKILDRYADRDARLFEAALERALRLIPDGSRRSNRIRYLETRLEGMKEAPRHARNHVATVLIREYEEAGKKEKASELHLRILRERRSDLSPLDDEKRLFRTGLRGGGGGGGFEELFPEEAVLIGFRYSTTVWSGHRIVRALQPLFDGPKGEASGAWHGKPGGKPSEVRAKKGYAVGGVIVRSGQRVDGMAVVFLRRRRGRLDPRDYYISEWFGGKGGGEALLGANGDPVVGLRGRSGADLDAIGLILRGNG
jgi:hypothetical protein